MTKTALDTRKQLFLNDGLALIYTGIDAITITNFVDPQEGDRVNARLWSAARIGEIAHAFREELYPNEEVKGFWANPGSWQCGSMVYRPSKTVCKLEVKGDVCNHAYALLMTWAEDEFKWTRLDLCADYSLRNPRAIVTYVQNRLSDKARDGAIMILNPKGDTLQIGSRQSAVYGRIYDKSSRYNLPLNSVYRFELEYKKLQPQAIVRAMRKNNDLEHFIRWSIHRQLNMWGVKMPAELAMPESLPEVQARVTTHDMRINFLRRQVKGVVSKLMMAGLEKEALEALGLQDYQRIPLMSKETK